MQFILDHICLKQKAKPAKKLQTWSTPNDTPGCFPAKAPKNSKQLPEPVIFCAGINKPFRFRKIPSIVAQIGEKQTRASVSNDRYAMIVKIFPAGNSPSLHL
ncbi:hypothetical protein NB640_10770 [Oxalobacter vibrioformis]|uniref:Uncharacterized protein n=1 Tax=Oxalobacter vibrioformis TaxID=933080 RepID=A0A9E9LV27_9BURK|nr:hypothetical protein [Oxalobacter vibrioformis]WAW09696.1 hypothetical protein NB640_10770 [Oxalobacter vibrioformis]